MKNIGAKAAALAAITILAACGGAKPATTAQLAGNASSFDKATVTVSGTAKAPATRETPRGNVVRYELCDGACINVVQFGDVSVTDGSKVTVSGTFHATFGRRTPINDVLVVGQRGKRADRS